MECFRNPIVVFGSVLYNILYCIMELFSLIRGRKHGWLNHVKTSYTICVIVLSLCSWTNIVGINNIEEDKINRLDRKGFLYKLTCPTVKVFNRKVHKETFWKPIIKRLSFVVSISWQYSLMNMTIKHGVIILWHL